MKVELRGFISDFDPEYKRIKVEYNSHEFTREWIAKRIDKQKTNPVFAGGFWIKHNNSTEFRNDTGRCIMQDLKSEHVIITANVVHYNYGGKHGWILRASSVVLEPMP